MNKNKLLFTGIQNKNVLLIFIILKNKITAEIVIFKII